MQKTPYFSFQLLERTTAGAAAFLADVLDPQIQETANQLALLQGLRRAIAGTFQIDREEHHESKFGEAAERAKRAELEGDADQTDGQGRLVPRMVKK